MSIVKDPALAEAGRKKIQWVRDFMPALSQIEARFLREKPFQGLRVAVSVHLEAKTANLGYVLQQGGAEVYLTGSNPLSTQDDVAAGLASMGVETFGIHGASPEEYQRHLTETLKCHPHLVIDDGGDLIDLLGGRCQAYADCLIGGCEETTTGILRLKAREKAGILPCPMMAVNDAKAKHYYDNKYGTGQSVWDGIMHTTNLVVAGKTVVVAGYGWCGKGVAMRAASLGAKVIVTEVDPVKAIEARMDGYDVMTMADAAPKGDIFVTVTGCEHVITGDHMMAMKEHAILSNAGHFNVEIDMEWLEANASEAKEARENITAYLLPDGKWINVLAEGRLVNIAASNGHPAEIMDMSFAVQALSALYVRNNKDRLENKVIYVTDEIDHLVACRRLEAWGITIDHLTDEQESYLNSWNV